MPPERTNTREFTRVPVAVRTEIRGGGMVLTGLPTFNLSLKGMAVRTETRLPLGTECDIEIVLVEGEVVIQLQGAAVVHLADGMAFQFTKILGLESYEHLRNLVCYNAPDVEQVESEILAHAGLRKRD